MEIVNCSINACFSKDVDVKTEDGKEYVVQLVDGKFLSEEHCTIWGPDGELDDDQLKPLLIEAAENFAEEMNECEGYANS